MTKTAGMSVAFLFVFGLCIAPFAVATPAQQTKMAACNAQANEKGLGEENSDERKAFIKECLVARQAKAVKAGGAQRSKMKTCNKEAGARGLKGDERKTFMSTCLSN
jgi:hypothetical protein